MAIATPTSAAPWRPDVNVFAAREVIPDALVLQCSTVVGKVDGDAPAVRVAMINDDNAEFVAEANIIPEAEPELAETTIHTGKVAQLVRVSNEQFHAAGTAENLRESVARAVTKRANAAFLTQVAPTSPAVTPPAGVLNTPGLVKGAAVGANLDPLVDLIAQLEANGSTPTHILAAPDTWAALRKIKTGTGSAVSLLGAGTTDAVRTLLDVPVITTSVMPSGTGLVLDSSAVLSAVGAVNVAVSEQAYFSSDSVGLRCTWRFGAAVARPDRVGTFTLSK